MSNAVVITQVLLAFLEKAAVLSQLLNTAASEGRDVSDAELDALDLGAQSSIDAARAAIAAKRAGPVAP